VEVPELLLDYKIQSTDHKKIHARSSIYAQDFAMSDDLATNNSRSICSTTGEQITGNMIAYVHVDSIYLNHL
jgi:hypothetical protein